VGSRAGLEAVVKREIPSPYPDPLKRLKDRYNLEGEKGHLLD